MNNINNINTQGGSAISGGITTETFIGRDQINIFFVDEKQIRILLAEYDLSEQQIEQYHEITQYVLVGILGIRIFSDVFIDYLQMDEDVPDVWHVNAKSYAKQFSELARRLLSAKIPKHAQNVRQYAIDASTEFKNAAEIFKVAASHNDLKHTISSLRLLEEAEKSLQKSAGVLVRAMDPTVVEADGGDLAVKLFSKIDFSLFDLTKPEH